jgi:predicted RNase H-like HicB family nuclease
VPNVRVCSCISWKTKQEAVANIKEAINAYIAALKDDNLPIPDENFDAMVVAV